MSSIMVCIVSGEDAESDPSKMLAVVYLCGPGVQTWRCADATALPVKAVIKRLMVVKTYSYGEAVG